MRAPKRRGALHPRAGSLVLGGDGVEAARPTCALCLREAHHDHHRVYGERSPGCLPEGEEGGEPAGEGNAPRMPGFGLLVWEEETLPGP